MTHIYCKTPFSDLKITQLNGCLHGLDFVDYRCESPVVDDTLLNETLRQIKQYLQSAAFVFDLPVNPQGTDFQRKVWDALCAIPAGEVKTYGALAKDLQSSARAVGNACRNNPVALIIPCHRVVSAQGIGGFVGQTQGQKISIKQQLLLHEGVEI